MSDRRTDPSDGDVDGASPAGMLRVRGTSKLAFGATTAALVTLASGGTAVLVARGTSTMYSPTALPIGGLLVDSGSGAVVVDRAPGTDGAVPAAPTTEEALRAVLAQRPPAGPRTLTLPLVDLNPGTPAPTGGLQLPGVPPRVPSLPGVKPPVVPPVAIPPVVTVPGVVPPVVTPPVLPVVPPVHAPYVPVPAVPVSVPTTKPVADPTVKPTTKPTTKSSDNSSSQQSGSSSSSSQQISSAKTTSSSTSSDSKGESSGSSSASSNGSQDSSSKGESSGTSKDSGAKSGSHSSQSALRVSAQGILGQVVIDLNGSDEGQAVRVKHGRTGRHAR